MRPDASAQRILSATRATAKMHEFRVAPEDFIALPRDPAILFALAIGLLGDVTAAIADQILADPAGGAMPFPSSWNEADPSPQEGLHFASIFFDAFLNSQLDNKIATEFSLLCGAAYYLGGNVGSAAVVIRQMEPPSLDLAGGLAFLVYAILAHRFDAVGDAHHHSEYTGPLLQSLSRFFHLEEDGFDVGLCCAMLREDVYTKGTPRELLYADIASAICVHKLRNAARAILPRASELDLELWRPALTKRHFPMELWPAQQRIADAGLLTGRSAVIQMPTSAGKTRGTELIIRSAFLSGRANIAVIVAPYRSLCHDIRGALTSAFFAEPVNLNEASDSYQADLALEQLSAKNSVLIVTPEKLLYLLRRQPELAAQIGLVIYDEGHQFDGMARGPTYELLLTSLRMVLNPKTQIVLISAVIGNAADVAQWLIGDASAVVDGAGLLPTTKSIAFASWQDQRGRLEYVSPLDPDEREYFVPRVIADTEIPKRGKERKERRFPEKEGGDVGLFLGLHVVRNGSVAIFCGRKDSVTKICERVVDIFDRGVELDPPLGVSDGAEMAKLLFLSEAELGAPAVATQAAGLGVLAHHADTPQGMRLAIEHAMKEGLAKFVVCTSTLAQGINFPLKYLIVTATRQGAEPILVRDFHNLMGRAGRAGMYTEGSVIFSSPAVYDQRRQFSGRFRWAEVIKLLDPSNSEPSRSSILALFEAYEQRGTPPIVQEILPEWLDLAFADTARIDSVVASALTIQPNINQREFRGFVEGRARAVQSIAAFLIANIVFADGEDVEARSAELATHTFAYYLADDPTRIRLIEVFCMIARSIVGNTNGDQRALIRRSPLPPAAVAALQSWLVDSIELLKTALAENKLLDVIAPTLLAFATSRAIRALSNRALVPRLLIDWVGGRSFAAIFAVLDDAGVRAGRGRVTVEDTVALCESGFGYDVAMIVASLADLVEHIDDELHSAIALLQRQVKCGVSSKAALAFHEAGFADRHVASLLALAWPGVGDRPAVIAVCRDQAAVVRAVLAHIPSYFVSVAAELGQWQADRFE